MTSTTQGSRHWWSQRVTAMMLVPLTVWFMFSIIRHTASRFDEVVAWMSQSWVAVLLILYLATMFYHAWLGVQVVVDDYIHSQGLKTISLLLGKGILSLSALVSIFAVLRTAM